MVLITFSTLISDEMLLFQWMNVDYEWQVKIIYGTLIGMAAFFPLLFHNVFPKKIHPVIIRGFTSYCAVYFLFVLLSPSSYILGTSAVLMLPAYLLTAAISVYIVAKAYVKEEGGFYLLLSCVSVVNHMIWSVVQIRSQMWKAFSYC